MSVGRGRARFIRPGSGPPPPPPPRKNLGHQIFKQNCAKYFDAKNWEDADTADDWGGENVPPIKVELDLKPEVKGDREWDSSDQVWTRRNPPLTRKVCLEIAPPPKPIETQNQAMDLEDQKPLSLEVIPAVEGKPPVAPPADPSNALILAVDATPTRGGGLLRLAGKERTIFFYSVDWSNRFDFQGNSTKFEMANTALALELFKPYLKAYRGRYGKLVVKTDSNFFRSMVGSGRDPYDLKFLSLVRNKVALYDGKFLHVTKSSKDKDIWNADYLSRTELPMGMKEGYEDGGEGEEVPYALVNLSEIVRNHILDVMVEEIPGRFVKL